MHIQKVPQKKKKNNCLCSSLHGWINCYESWLCSKIILLLSCTRACFFVKSFNKKIKFKAKKKFNDNITRYNCLWFISVACFSYPITRLSMLLLLLLLLLHIFFIIIIIIFFPCPFCKTVVVCSWYSAMCEWITWHLFTYLCNQFRYEFRLLYEKKLFGRFRRSTEKKNKIK